MATVTIPLEDDGNSIRMPRLCIVCGRANCRMKKTTFSARYSTLGGFGRGGTRFLYTTVPLCTEHWGHFDAYTYLGLGLAAVVFLCIGLGALCGIVFKIFVGAAIAIAVAILSMLAYAVVSFLMKGSMVHATSITSDRITLTNVHHKFAAAVGGDQASEDLTDDNDAPRRRRRGGDDADEDWGFRKQDREAAGKYALYIWLIVAGVFLFMFCGISTLVLVFIANLKPSTPPGPGAVPPPGGRPAATQPSPLPIDPGWDEKTMRPTYLSDLQEHAAHVGWGQFGKNGRHGFDHKGVPPERNLIRFKGKESPRALSTHAATGSPAFVKYRLDGKYRLFRGTTAMADIPDDAWRQEASNPVTFTVLGDGRLLWASRPLQKKGDSEAFRLGVRGVRELELRAYCAGQADYTWSVWLEPRLLE